MTSFETQSHGCESAVIYCRVSSKKQVTMGDGLGSQETRCREYAKYKGYGVAEVFGDDLSGGSAKRPGMEALLKFLKSQKNKERYVILIDDISRLARDIRIHLDLRDAINEVGAVLESPSLEFKNDPDSIYFENMQAINAQHQRLKNAEQTRNRMQARVMSGYYCFAKPMGYVYSKIEGHGKLLVRNEPLASIIEEGLTGYSCGRFQTQAEVMRFFQSFPEFPKDRNGTVRNQRVNDILTRPVYAGYVEAPSWDISLRKGRHDGLISFETYQKIQERLGGNAKVPARKNLNADFPLRGAVVCGDCDSPLTACWSKGKSKLYAYYLCHSQGCVSYRKSIPRQKIEGEFEALLKQLQPSKTLFQVTKAMFKDVWTYRLNNAAEQEQSMKKELLKIEKQTEHLLDRIVDSSSPSVISAYETRIAKLENERLVMKEKLQSSGKPRHTFDEMFEHSMTFLSSPWKLWGSDRLELKRIVLKLAFANRLAYCRNQGFRTPDLALPFKALSDNLSVKKEMVRPKRFELLTP